MEKLFNWTIGSFFRTIGRLIAYFAIGAFIAYILSNSNIKLPFRISGLFLDRVNALSLDGTYSHEYKLSNDPTLISVSETDQLETYNFTNSFNSYDDNFAIFTLSGLQYMQNDIDMDASYNFPVQLLSMYIQVTLQTNGTWQTCEIQNNLIVCPLGKNTTNTALRFYFNAPTTWTNSFYEFRANINNYVITMKSSTSAITDSIDSQTQQQQQQHNETMTIITDTNTTQDQNETTSFFEGFEFSSDNSGLLGVITAPLRVINSIVSGQFSDLCFTLKSKNVCFPNGNMIWQKSNRDSTWFGSGSISTGIQAFVSLFNLVAGGYILYKMGVSIKRLTEDLINPTNTRIEVMKL